ncbi:MAG: GC-type dockerin domain-anchored protein [Planctomycetota bacterium]
MNTASRLCLTLVALPLCGGAVMAQPLILDVDPSRSTVEITITLNTPVGSRIDSDSAPVTGFVQLGADDYGVPMSAVFYDTDVALTEDLNLNWSFGFPGSADATVTGAGLAAAEPGVPEGPVPVAAGSFVVPTVSLIPRGLAAINYDILLVGADSIVLDLSADGAVETSLSGTLVNIGEGAIELSTTTSFTGTVELIEGLVTADVTTTATVVAAAVLPDCPADVAAPFGALNFFDVSAFINAFVAQDPSADFLVDGVFNFFDVSAYITSFSAGCP